MGGSWAASRATSPAPSSRPFSRMPRYRVPGVERRPLQATTPARTMSRSCPPFIRRLSSEVTAEKRGTLAATRGGAPPGTLTRALTADAASRGREPLMPQCIFAMKDLRKVTPQGKEILKGIWLSFYAGAKIGVLGHNGAGKSTLLRIMAGLDHDVAGEAFPAEGASVGLLSQEPVLD